MPRRKGLFEDLADIAENIKMLEQEREIEEGEILPIDIGPSPWDEEYVPPAETQEPIRKYNGKDEEEGVRPDIEITTDLPAMADQAEAAILALPGPIVFQRARLLRHIVPAGPSTRYLKRAPDVPIIAPIVPANLLEYACVASRWIKFNERSKSWKPAHPSTKALDILAARATWKFPPLEGIVFAPTIRSDGVLLTRPGYDPDTGLYLCFQEKDFPEIPPAPTQEDAQAAVGVLFEPFIDFPLKEHCHWMAVVAAILTLVGRFAIDGSIPLFAVRSTRRGSGKGLLIDAIATIGTGRPAPTWTQVIDDVAEERKQLLAVALEGAVCMHIDNVTAPLGSAPLDSAITSRETEGRLLGTNSTIKAPWLTMVFASGNNMVFHADTARRVVPIDLDPKMEHPEDRNGFRHSPLLEWVAQERPRFVVAALTILKAFIDAGKPQTASVIESGSFESWAHLIRHALLWTGYDDPWSARQDIEATSDTGYERHVLLLQSWYACYETKAVTLRTALQDAEQRRVEMPTSAVPGNDWNGLFEALTGFDEYANGKRWDAVRIGNALRKIEGAVIGSMRLIVAPGVKTPKKWQIELIH